MTLQKASFTIILFLAVYIATAQNSLPNSFSDAYHAIKTDINAYHNFSESLRMPVNPSYFSQKEVFGSSETSLIAYGQAISDDTKTNLISLESVDSERLARSLTAMHFKKQRSGMEKTGRILTYIGVPLAIVGGIMVAGSDELYYECVNGNCRGDARGGFGVVFLAAGIGLSGTGSVLWITGRKR